MAEEEMSTEMSASEMSASPTSRLHLGAAYYPEHWPEERWAEDIRLMREVGLTVARMGEFAWSTMEPAEGAFQLDWLERAASALAEAGIVTVLGTPTAAPPAWLVARFPDLLAVDEGGQRVQFGNRCHYCVNSSDLHAATRRIVGAMAERFGENPNVIGWQLDNEYNRVCYCDRCRRLFQEYLAEAYGSLEALNQHWTTAYWSQTYSAWEQIPIPVGPHNPGLMLAFKRFVTESYRRFQRLQLEVLRPQLRPEVWVTHNFMNWHGGYDHYRLSEDLDLASWDWYVGSGHHDYLTSGAAHDLVRGFKRRNFWLMETQPGNVNWHQVNNSLNKGEGRTMAWHAVAHGADAVLYWQWRSALGGQEQYHGTLVDQSGQPRPFYQDVWGVGREFATVSSLLAGTTPRAEVAILNSYDSRWSIQWQPHHKDFDYVAHLLHYYKPFAARNIPVDIISADEPFDGYRLIVAPALVILDDAMAQRLRAFVERSRYLVLTARCGVKDPHNALLPARPPGPLADLAGVEVEEYYALEEPVPVIGNWFTGVATLWAERLKPLEDVMTAAIARYGPSNGWLDGQQAITVRSIRSGLVYYVGAYLDEGAQEALFKRIIETTRLKPVMDTPAGVEAAVRVTPEGNKIYIVINHTRELQTVTLPWPAHEHLSGRSLRGEIKLAAYGVTVLTPAEED
jgi:beta-galactosidase